MGWGVSSQIKRRRESLVLYKSLNTKPKYLTQIQYVVMTDIHNAAGEGVRSDKRCLHILPQNYLLDCFYF
jgi:hypothetical protein